MSERDSKLMVEDILSCIGKIERYTLNLSFEDFLHDELRIDAVVRNLEVIGEASKRIHPDFKQSSNIPWREISGLRNKIVHEYFGVDLEIIWDIVQNDLSVLRAQLLLLLDEID
ncbi:MAG: DUF86 domain-containing protein [Imperialibacter sp.]|uniref:HepT-like ribonuclease domain-containing protein n=1 Tax=Imperialibacter sp. TaxID=2038411 RepID=UPI003A86A501